MAVPFMRLWIGWLPEDTGFQQPFGADIRILMFDGEGGNRQSS